MWFVIQQHRASSTHECGGHATLLNRMGRSAITDELVQQVADDLRARYSLDEDAVRELGHKLADADRHQRRTENEAFAVQFVTEHQETFDRLAT